ncbi:MAG TPA: polyprenol monophosphomannose synthase [Microthrixaceae bacterium]|nr:polyprenol monophosphomannose synthase [Microthrixaceae bacterium]
MRAVLVIPTYQEAENVERLLREIRSNCPDLSVMIVDDNSPDGTADLAEATGREIGNVEVVRRPGKAGLGVAYRHGFRHALSLGFEIIGQMDADFSHDPSVLPALFEAVEAGADVAVGSRYVPGGKVPNWTWIRRKLSIWGNTYAHRMLKLSFNDATTAFRIYRSEVLEGIDIDGTTANGYLFQIETAFRISDHGFKVVELPITFLDRVAGQSKMAVVRTIVETQFRVTWWGLALRAPGVTGIVRRTPPGRYLESRVRPRNWPTEGP